jgi:Leucine-rich repeat (LRR) protein
LINIINITAVELHCTDVKCLQSGVEEFIDTNNNINTTISAHPQIVHGITINMATVCSKLKILNVNNCSLTVIDLRQKMKFLKKLSLTNNNLTQLQNNIFSNAPKLTELRLSNNQISQISAKAFANLTELGELYLNGNCIIDLKNTTFVELKSLFGVYLQNNRLLAFDFELFEKNKELIIVDLSWNRIKNIHSNNDNRTKVKDIFLGNNQLTNVHVIARFKNLEGLYLDNNSELKVETLSLEGCVRTLKILDVSGIKTQNNYSFLTGMEVLNNLTITNNSLNYIDFEILPELKGLLSLSMSGNELGYIKNFQKIKTKFVKLNSLKIFDQHWDAAFLDGMIAKAEAMPSEKLMFTPPETWTVLSNGIEDAKKTETFDENQMKIIHHFVIPFTITSIIIIVLLLVVLCKLKNIQKMTLANNVEAVSTHSVSMEMMIFHEVNVDSSNDFKGHQNFPIYDSVCNDIENPALTLDNSNFSLPFTKRNSSLYSEPYAVEATIPQDAKLPSTIYSEPYAAHDSKNYSSPQKSKNNTLLVTAELDSNTYSEPYIAQDSNDGPLPPFSTKSFSSVTIDDDKTSENGEVNLVPAEPIYVKM